MAEGIELSIGPNHMRAAAVDSVLVPRQRIHERLDENAERMALIELEAL